MGKSPVQTFTDGKQYWFLHLVNKFHFSLIFTSLCIALVTSTGVPYWWPENDGITITASYTNVSFLLFAFLATSLFYLKGRIDRSLHMKCILHRIAHEARDYYSVLCGSYKTDQSIDIVPISGKLCGLVKEYFEILTNCKKVDVALRIARTKNGKKVYETIVRTSGLNVKRSETSEPLPYNVGIAKFLQDDQGSQGLVVYHDLEKAAEAKAYRMTENDRIYPEEIKTMMVAPVNGWDGEKKSMLAILYVTSNKMRIFGRQYTDSMGFIADILAGIYAAAISKTMDLEERKELRKLKVILEKNLAQREDEHAT